MVKTLAIIGLHKQEAYFGHRLKHYMMHCLPDIVSDSYFAPNLRDKILFQTAPISCNNTNNGQTVRARARADRGIVKLMQKINPQVLVDIHNTEDREIPLRTELWVCKNEPYLTQVIERLRHLQKRGDVKGYGETRIIISSPEDYDPLENTGITPTCPVIGLEMYIPQEKRHLQMQMAMDIAGDLLLGIHLAL